MSSQARKRSRSLIAALIVMAMTGGMLWLTAEEPPGPSWWYFFGLWRTRYAAGALVGVVVGLLLLLSALSRRSLFAGILVLLCLAITVGALEAAGRLGVVSFADLFGLAPTTLGRVPAPHLMVTGVTWQDTANRYKIESEPIRFRYRTDQRGFRNDLDREEADVYLLGDSYLVGAIVPFPETVTGRLESRIDRPVMNISLIDKGVQEERDLLWPLGLNLEDRVVLQFVFEGNDLYDSARYGRRLSRGGGEETEETGSSFLRAIMLVLQRATSPTHPSVKRRMGYIGEDCYTFTSGRNSAREFDEQVPHVLDTLQDMAAKVRSAGGHYGVVFIPKKLRILGPHCRWLADSDLTDFERELVPLPEALATWSRETGIPLLDLCDAMSESVERGDVTWFPYDTHWNQAGHDVAARAVAEWAVFRAWIGDE